MLTDLRLAIRALARSPGYTVAAVLTLALGIGAVTAVFALVNGVLLRPPGGVATPERLVGVYTSDHSGPAYGANSYPDVREFAGQRDLFSGVAAYAPRPGALGESDAPERVMVDVVNGGYFATLGVRPVLGRLLGEADGRAGAPGVVISESLWRRRFAADPTIVGRAVPVNGRPVTVVGVAPAEFTGMMRGIRTDVWLPLEHAAPFGLGADVESRGSRGLFALARLAPGVGRARAQAQLATVAARLHAEFPDAWGDVRGEGRRISLRPEPLTRIPAQVQNVVLGLVALFAVTVGLVLLICCANVAGLAIARGTRRAREHAVRLSLGATRLRLVCHLLAESLVVAALGGVVGAVVALWLVDLVRLVTIPAPVPIALDLSPDARVLGFALLATALTGVLFGLAPALRASRTDLVSVFKADRASIAVGRRRLPLQSALVIVQMAASVLLLATALLFVRAIRGAAHADPGFVAEGVLLARTGPAVPGVNDTATNAAGLAFRDRIRAIPGVRSVTWATVAPLGLDVSRRGTWPGGYVPAQGEDIEVAFNVVGPAYFATLGIPLLAGRDFADTDRAGSEGVVVVNEAFAQRYWPGESALGRTISNEGPRGRPLRVIGVVRTSRYQSLAEEPRPYVYYPALQSEGWGVTLHVRQECRAACDPAALVPAVRAAVEEARAGWTVEEARTLASHVERSLLPQRMASLVLGGFGLVALLLASIGLFGVVAYTVAARSYEIGVRIALGARAADVQRLVLRQSGTLAVAGILLGLPLSWGAARLLDSLLLGGSGGDALPFLAAAALLAVAALLATALPARRASRVDPAVALRAN